MRHRAVMLFCTLALAVPATAAGQSAGDEQYEDPFAPGTEEPQATPEAAPAPAAGGESSAPTPAPARDPAAEANAAQQLPYSGGDVGIVLAAGAALLAGGVALRIRLRA